MPAPPWHMWGSVQTVNVESDIVQFSQTSQLAQVSYRRPDTWEFFFKVKVLQINGSSAGSTMTVDFNLTFGVGRASTKLAPFARFVFTPAELSALSQKFCTRIEVPKIAAADVGPNIIDHIVAETIQVESVVTFDILGLITPGSQIECVAFFAPRTHIRPEWHDGKFPGGETRGH